MNTNGNNSLSSNFTTKNKYSEAKPLQDIGKLVNTFINLNKVKKSSKNRKNVFTHQHIYQRIKCRGN